MVKGTLGLLGLRSPDGLEASPCPDSWLGILTKWPPGPGQDGQHTEKLHPWVPCAPKQAAAPLPMGPYHPLPHCSPPPEQPLRLCTAQWRGGDALWGCALPLLLSTLVVRTSSASGTPVADALCQAPLPQLLSLRLPMALWCFWGFNTGFASAQIGVSLGCIGQLPAKCHDSAGLSPFSAAAGRGAGREDSQARKPREGDEERKKRERMEPELQERLAS